VSVTLRIIWHKILRAIWLNGQALEKRHRREALVGNRASRGFDAAISKPKSSLVLFEETVLNRTTFHNSYPTSENDSDEILTQL
jgi:hypothetical protein